MKVALVELSDGFVVLMIKSGKWAVGELHHTREAAEIEVDITLAQGYERSPDIKKEMTREQYVKFVDEELTRASMD